MAVKYKLYLWMIMNFIGIALYLRFASWTWISKETDFMHAAGDPFIWMMCAFPFLVGFSLANLGWLGWIIYDARRGMGWRPILAWAFMFFAWFAAFRYDAYNQ